MQQSPELCHGVLNGGPSKQKPIPTLELQEYLPTNAGTTLERLSLVQYHVLPLDSLEILYILHHQLVTGDNHMEGGILGIEGLLTPEPPDDFSIMRISPIW